jgi:hypothetical protein
MKATRLVGIIAGLMLGVAGLGITMAAPAHAEDSTFASAGGVSVVDFGDGSPYPSAITVSGTGAPITGVRVALNGLASLGMSHTYVALVAPNGDSLMLLGKAGNANAVSGVNLVLSDSATDFINQVTGPSSGTFKPSYYGGITFNQPGPGNLYAKPGPQVSNTATFASVFGGDLADGTWKLFVHNDGGGFSITSWSITISTARVPAPAAPDTTIVASPAKKVKTTKQRAKVVFGFTSPSAGATFQCSMDGSAFTDCAAPKRYKVHVGKHTFAVRAVTSGVVDASPATYSFKVKQKKKHRQ